jgi:cytochrome c-type protein NapB
MRLLRNPELFFLILVTVLVALGASSQRVAGGGGLTMGQPGMNTFPETAPGETTKLERAYPGAPPFVPHSVVGLSISRSTNDCLDCHAEGIEVEEGHVATKVPPSHYTNDYSKEQREDQVIGMRYNCLQCHLPQSSEDSPFDPQKSN